ncbi:hypothetical protein B5M09_004570 [Aphanomyces astaci]|uniref:Uncharacterized protein n=1 Tax=Aphanomyces astaci TaxID=112090 RepID=A0A3R7Y7V0_APHAT|nr:hypothetical protein B5M09_004570 [Aphanomyces astaci]
MTVVGGGVLADGATTYCWASNASTTAAQVDVASFGVLGTGNGYTCPVWVSLNVNRTYATGAKPTISWALLMLDPSASSSWAAFALNPITQNVTTSQLFYCQADAEENCRPFRGAAKPLSSPIFAQSFQQKSASFSSVVELPSTPGTYIVFATTTLPTAVITSNRLDIALFTTITITGQVQAESSAASHTAMYVGVGVGAALLVLGIVLWCCITRRRMRRLEMELHRATFATSSLPRSVSSYRPNHHVRHDSHLHSLPKLSFSSHQHGGVARLSCEDGVDYALNRHPYHHQSPAIFELSPRQYHHHADVDFVLHPRLSASEYYYPQELPRDDASHHHVHSNSRQYSVPRNSDHYTDVAFFPQEEDTVGDMYQYWRQQHPQPTTPSDSSTDYSTQPQYPLRYHGEC